MSRQRWILLTPGPPVSPAETLDDDANEPESVPPAFSESADEESAADGIVSPLHGSDKRAYDDFKRDGDDKELLDQLAKRSRASGELITVLMAGLTKVQSELYPYNRRSPSLLFI